MISKKRSSKIEKDENGDRGTELKRFLNETNNPHMMTNEITIRLTNEGKRGPKGRVIILQLLLFAVITLAIRGDKSHQTFPYHN